MSHLNRRARSGFTLIEVMVALVLSAIVLLGARAMLGEVGDDTLRIAAQARKVDGDANGERTLRALVGNLELGAGDSTQFAGDPRRASFSSWCDIPAGWQERCAVSLIIERRADGDALVIHTSQSGALVVREHVRAGSLRYLSTVSSGGEWIRIWGAGITAPLAIGVILDADTLIVPIGERG
jgi:prepilin-type N-terminal cleavage/methylation domain-containing protein